MFMSMKCKLSVVGAAAFCLFFAPTANAAKYCNLERSLKSPDSVIKMPIKFVNHSRYRRHVYWLNYSGNREIHEEILPGKSQEFDTYVGHLWVATRSKHCIGIYSVDPQPRTVNLW